VPVVLRIIYAPGPPFPAGGAGGASDRGTVAHTAMLTIMKKKVTLRDRDSFVVRICREEGQLGWHGWIQHARSRDETFFRNLDDLLRFIEQRTGGLKGPGTKGGLR
jgi:hypothetical protein